jgi:ElaB/YqjD/DUF883 family membrane-anchored ribosome-binding protein
MKHRTNAARRGVDAIQKELAAIEEEAMSLARSLGNAASDEAGAALKSIRKGVDRLAGESGMLARAGVGAVEGTIEANPFISVAIALGVGALLAILLPTMLRR